MNKKYIIFDLDDTLIPNAKFYKQTKDSLWKLFNRLFNKDRIKITKAKFIKTLDSNDYKKTKELSLSRTRFPLSAVQTYFQYCRYFNKPVDFYAIQEIIVCANGVFDYSIKLTQKTKEVLTELKKNPDYRMFLFTAGDKLVQSNKIFQGQLYRYFDEQDILIVPEKTESMYKDCFGKFGIENCIMIGNDKKSDVKPAIEQDMYAIYIPAEKWEYDRENIDEQSEKLRIAKDISEIPKILKDLFNDIHWYRNEGIYYSKDGRFKIIQTTDRLDHGDWKLYDSKTDSYYHKPSLKDCKYIAEKYCK